MGRKRGPLPVRHDVMRANGQGKQVSKRTVAKWTAVLNAASQGIDFDEIAAEYGYADARMVERVIYQLMRHNLAEAVETFRAAETVRFAAMLSIYMPKAMAGDLEAARFVKDASVARWKLMGACLPERAPVDEHGKTVRPYDINELRSIIDDANA